MGLVRRGGPPRETDVLNFASRVPARALVLVLRFLQGPGLPTCITSKRFHRRLTPRFVLDVDVPCRAYGSACVTRYRFRGVSQCAEDVLPLLNREEPLLVDVFKMVFEDWA